jgi:CheY-like chemotaxis protein
VIQNLFRYCVGVLFLLMLLAPSPGQDSRQFYKKPETTSELWRYMNHEIEIGNYKLAAEYLKGFVAKTPSEEELLHIQETEGSSTFLRLLAIPELQASAKPLIDRVNDVLQKHLSDPKRLNRLIKNLTASAEEREYSIAQLRRSGPLAVPALVQALLDSVNNPAERAAMLAALGRLDRNAMPPLYAALGVADPTVRREIIDIIRQKGDTSAVPFLWYYAASPTQPELVRAHATETVAALLDVPPGKLPTAKTALVQDAENYYRHRVHFGDPSGVRIWRWDGKQLVSEVLSASDAEEYYGLRAARQALELDPAYLPAQVVFLNIALDKAYQRAGLDQPLAKGTPGVKDLLNSVNPQLVIAVLNRALDERRLPVILAATRGLGDLAEVRAVKQAPGTGTPAIVRALYFPDPRVQMAAVDALLRIPATPSPVAAARAVEVLRRAIAGAPAPKVLVADMNEDRGNAVAAAVRKAGFDTVVVRTGREVLRRLDQAADIDAVLVDADTPDPQLPYLLGQLRADVNAGLLAVIVTAPSNRLKGLDRLAEHYRNVWVAQATTDADDLKRTLIAAIADSMGKPLSEAERKNNAVLAMEWLTRISRGELPGYDIRPAQSAILETARDNELAPRAIEAAGRLPGRDGQRALATVVLDSNRPLPLRSEAAVELTRHIQRFGLLLSRNQVAGLEEAFGVAKDDKLKANLAQVVGSMHPDERQTGERLRRFAPKVATPGSEQAPKPQTAPEKDSDQ